jgi:hypothetical protein
MPNFKSGSIELSGDINALRELVEDITSSIGDGNELPSYITDLFFSIESEYQKFHNLSEDDYEIHSEKH